MNEYDKRWHKRLRGPYETTDAVRYVVAPNRRGVTVVCPLCGTHVHPGSLVAEVGGEAVCMACQPPGGSRIRAGLKRPKETLALALVGFALDGASLWADGGHAWVFAKGSGPVGHTVYRTHKRIGHLTRSTAGWSGSVVVERKIGEVELLVPVKVSNVRQPSSLPGELYLREAAERLLFSRLHEPEAFRRMQLAARMRLWAWNKGEK